MIRWLLCALLAAPLVAQEAVTKAEIPLGDLLLTWSAGSGLGVSYGGHRVFLPNTSELVLHDAKWTRQYYNSAGTGESGTLEQRGEQRILTVRHQAPAMQATQQIIAGPGERFQVVWTYRQDAADDGALQFGLSKPAESFWAGAPYEALSGGRSVKGVIPVTYSKDSAHPFSDAKRLEVRSLFGTLVITSARPLVLFDYAKRGGAFWLGNDLPLPRGAEQRQEVTFEFAPARLERGGTVLGGVRLNEVVADGLLRLGVTLARTATGPARARLAAEVKRGDQVVATPAADVTLTAAAQTVELTAPVTARGAHQVAFTVTAGGQELYRSPTLVAQAEPAMGVAPSRSSYTGEREAALLVTVRPEVPAEGLRIEATGGALRVSGPVTPGQRTAVAFDPSALPEGATALRCRLLIGERVAWEEDVTVRRLPPRPNEVKIDYASRGLLVDGLPLLPCGFYVRHPATGIPETEAPYGFTHFAPYRGSASALTSDERRREMLAILDRYAALGLKVHYDVRPWTEAEDQPDKWANLRREVEAVKDHPALLAWYLADEPELRGYPPEKLAEAYRLIKEIDPYHPCTQVFANRDKAPDYLGGMDIIMSDPYPIPSSPVTVVGDATERLDRAVASALPVWIVPQAFGGGEWWKREPSPREQRVMTWLALLRGATGIQWFIRDFPHARPLPELMSECRTLAGEIAELTPVLLSTLPGPQVTCPSEAVVCRGYRTPDALWAIAVNTVNEPGPLELTIAGAPDGAAAVELEQRQVKVAGGLLRDVIDAFGTRIYRLPLQPEDPQAGLAPGNLTVNPSFEEQHNLGSPDGYYLGGTPDLGAQVRVDSRLAKHGRHSLRLVAPAAGKGYAMRPFPVTLTPGQSYRLSIWARSLQPGVKLSFGVSGIGAKDTTAALTGDWQEVVVTGQAPADAKRGQIRYAVESAGTVWVDLLQFAPVP